MARASTRTFLSLDKYAKIMGINPVFFNGGSQISLSNGKAMFPLENAVNDIWPQYSWQNNDQISREDLAHIIQVCEVEIVNYLGFSPVPLWISRERHELPNHYRPDLRFQRVKYDVSGKDISIKTNLSEFISGGVRKSTLLEADVNVVYSDPDGDGWNELATVTVTVPTGAEITEYKIYFSGRDGSETFEIREPKTKWIAGNTLTATYPSWVMVNPDLYEVNPTDDTDGKFVDMEDSTIFIRTVDVYRVYNDTTQNHVVFNTINVLTGAVSQEGGFIYTIGNLDSVSVVRGTYDSTAGAWTRNTSECAYPDYVDLWYYSGMRSGFDSAKSIDDLLPSDIATAIAYMATARLERVFYANNNATSLAADLRDDILRGVQGEFKFPADEVRSNPFGSKVGEFKAWKLIKRYTARRFGGAAI